MKHAIVTACRFADKELMWKYLRVSKEMLIPSLKAQTVQNFEWVVLIREEDVDIVREYLDMNFTLMFTSQQLSDYLIDEGFNIQTRHDIDDWMAPTYIEEIQALYNREKDNHKQFLIQAQPKKLIYQSGVEVEMSRYHKRKTSMFLSLCQPERVIQTVRDKKHGQMWQMTPEVFNVPDGLVKWVIHGNNISVIGRTKK